MEQFLYFLLGFVIYIVFISGIVIMNKLGQRNRDWDGISDWDFELLAFAMIFAPISFWIFLLSYHLPSLINKIVDKLDSKKEDEE